MSHVRHEVGCVTTYKKELVEELHASILEIGLVLTDIGQSPVNGYFTFFIFPSGSKAGWPEAVSHMQKIAEAKEICESYAYEDGSSQVDFCFPMYGEFEG